MEDPKILFSCYLKYVKSSALAPDHLQRSFGFHLQKKKTKQTHPTAPPPPII